MGRVRPTGLVVAATLTVVVAAACADSSPPPTPVATAACDEVAFPELQFGSHLIGDGQPPVPYSSVPPTSGWHRSGAPPIGVFTEPLSEPAQVSTLEAGGVVITHGDLPSGEERRLRRVAADSYGDRVAVTPYPPLEVGEVVFTSWGSLQRCDTLDMDALQRYVEAYADPVEDPHTQADSS